MTKNSAMFKYINTIMPTVMINIVSTPDSAPIKESLPYYTLKSLVCFQEGPKQIS